MPCTDMFASSNVCKDTTAPSSSSCCFSSNTSTCEPAPTMTCRQKNAHIFTMLLYTVLGAVILIAVTMPQRFSADARWYMVVGGASLVILLSLLGMIPVLSATTTD